MMWHPTSRLRSNMKIVLSALAAAGLSKVANRMRTIEAERPH